MSEEFTGRRVSNRRQERRTNWHDSVWERGYSVELAGRRSPGNDKRTRTWFDRRVGSIDRRKAPRRETQDRRGVVSEAAHMEPAKVLASGAKSYGSTPLVKPDEIRSFEGTGRARPRVRTEQELLAGAIPKPPKLQVKSTNRPIDVHGINPVISPFKRGADHKVKPEDPHPLVRDLKLNMDQGLKALNDSGRWIARVFRNAKEVLTFKK